MSLATPPDATAATTGGDGQRSNRYEDRFIAYLARICQDPGTRAALRRAARRRPADASTAHRYLAAWVTPAHGAWAEEVTYQVASWVALHERDATGPRRSLGAALAHATKRPGAAGLAEQSAQTRLLGASRADATALLYEHLPRLLTVMASAGQVPDLARLMREVRWWPLHAPETAKRWAGDYYRTLDALSVPRDTTAPGAPTGT